MRSEHRIGWWLIGMCALVFAMVVVGGATRLTDSGLSITEWRPVTGAIPPLTDAGWQEEFNKYRQIPEYQRVNKGMSLAEFQFIYYWEWGHRLLGRLIGAAFLIGFLYFLLTRQVPRPLIPKLVLMFILGGAQGFLGWYMVQSGLVDRVDVSQYRLTAHLGLALIIFAFMFWVALDLLRGSTPRVKGGMGAVPLVAGVVVGLTFFQIFLGGFVAGLKAGLTYNTWPLMDGSMVPDGLMMMSPWYLNFFENVIAVQFNHRIGAYVLAAGAGVFWWLTRKERPEIRRAGDFLALAVFAQILLGIWTLLAVVPISLGVLHQAGSVVVLTAALYAAHVAFKMPRTIPPEPASA